MNFEMATAIYAAFSFGMVVGGGIIFRVMTPAKVKARVRK